MEKRIRAHKNPIKTQHQHITANSNPIGSTSPSKWNIKQAQNSVKLGNSNEKRNQNGKNNRTTNIQWGPIKLNRTKKNRVQPSADSVLIGLIRWPSRRLAKGQHAAPWRSMPKKKTKENQRKLPEKKNWNKRRPHYTFFETEFCFCFLVVFLLLLLLLLFPRGETARLYFFKSLMLIYARN